MRCTSSRRWVLSLLALAIPLAAPPPARASHDVERELRRDFQFQRDRLRDEFQRQRDELNRAQRAERDALRLQRDRLREHVPPSERKYVERDFRERQRALGEHYRHHHAQLHRWHTDQRRALDRSYQAQRNHLRRAYPPPVVVRPTAPVWSWSFRW